MKTEYRIVCLIDILGFQEIVNEFDKTNDISIIEKIQSAFNSAMQTITMFRKPENHKIMDLSPEKVDLLAKDILYKTFSDNVLISIIYNEDKDSFLRRLSLILIFSNLFQYEMLSKGVYTRGGISFGSFFSDDNIIFSSALVKAHIIESKIANYPRIVLDPRIIESISYLKDIDKEDEFGFYDMIYFDDDEIAFLSPFSPFDSLAKMIEELFMSINFSANPLFEVLNSLPENIKQIAKRPFNSLLDYNKNIIVDIKSKSIDGKYSGHIQQKYLWLIEFYKWKYEDSNSNKFRRFKDK